MMTICDLSFSPSMSPSLISACLSISLLKKKKKKKDIYVDHTCSLSYVLNLSGKHFIMGIFINT